MLIAYITTIVRYDEHKLYILRGTWFFVLRLHFPCHKWSRKQLIFPFQIKICLLTKGNYSQDMISNGYFKHNAIFYLSLKWGRYVHKIIVHRIISCQNTFLFSLIICVILIEMLNISVPAILVSVMVNQRNDKYMWF